MPWFWGRGDQDDPAKSLDPDLKKFLDEQETTTYQPVEPPVKPQRPSNTYVGAPESDLDPDADPADRPLPKESLYQDGRYKHLWKTYIPQAELIASTTNPLEKVIAQRKERTNSVIKAAMENCAFENELQRLCLGGPGFTSSIKSKLTMCAEETKTYHRCYSLQSKFLHALGYMSDMDSTDEHEERIQMHADKLYHQMMDYEDALEHARRNDLPVPPLTSVFDPRKPAPTMDEFQFPPRIQEKLATILPDLPPHERELTARAEAGDIQFGQDNAEEFFKRWKTQNEGRMRRQKMVSNLFGEVIGKFVIPDMPDEVETENGANSAARDVWVSHGQSTTPAPANSQLRDKG